MWLVTIVFWLQAFAAPFILFGLIGLAFRDETTFFVLLGIGVVAGIIVAEYIRRKIGLDVFFGRIYGPNEMDKKIRKKSE